MILFVTALFDADGAFLECAAAEVPIWPEGGSLFAQPHASCGVVRLKDGVNPNAISRYVVPDGEGGARFTDNIGEIAVMCCRRTPATESLLTEKLAAEGQSAMHLIARTWLATKLPEEKLGLFGPRIEADARAVPLVETMMARKYEQSTAVSGFKKFERRQVAAVHQRIAAESAFEEMRDAINPTPTDEAA